jgi:lipopolysaccharide biosynthesis glycosyltransferase
LPGQITGSYGIQTAAPPINVGYFFLGLSEDTSMKMVVSLNSLLYYNSKSMIHLYIVLDDEKDQKRISQILDAASMRNFKAYFIPLPVYLKEAISSLDTSGLLLSRWLMYKLVPERLFPVHDILVVDIDTVFLRDISQLYHEEITVMQKEDQVARITTEMGAIPKSGEYPEIAYLFPEKVSQWQGLNTGVAFFNLDKMRRDRWDALLRKTLKETPKEKLPALNIWGDQNWFNYVFKLYFHGAVGFLSNDWNTQLVAFGESASKVINYINTRADSLIILHGNGGKFKYGHIITQKLWCAFTEPFFFRTNISRAVPAFCKETSTYYTSIRSNRTMLLEFLRNVS